MFNFLVWSCCASDGEDENVKLDSLSLYGYICFFFSHVLSFVWVQILKNTTGNKRGGGGSNADASL